MHADSLISDPHEKRRYGRCPGSSPASHGTADSYELLVTSRVHVKLYYQIADGWMDWRNAEILKSALIDSLQPDEDGELLLAWLDDPDDVDLDGAFFAPEEQPGYEPPRA